MSLSLAGKKGGEAAAAKAKAIWGLQMIVCHWFKGPDTRWTLVLQEAEPKIEDLVVTTKIKTQ